jgi:hypothetical protein
VDSAEGRDPKQVAEVEGIDCADWRRSGAIEFTANHCESRHGSQTSQQSAAADTGRHQVFLPWSVLIKDSHHGRNRAARSLLAAGDTWDRFSTYADSGSVG